MHPWVDKLLLEAVGKPNEAVIASVLTAGADAKARKKHVFSIMLPGRPGPPTLTDTEVVLAIFGHDTPS